MVTYFKYLGRVLTAADDDWPAVVWNLRKEQKSSECMTRVMGQEGASPWVLGIIFKAMMQAVLLFGSDTWVMNP